MKGVPEVGELSKALGDLMREGIKGKEFIPLDKEIDNLKKYVYIQQYRYGDKFEVSIDIDPNALFIQVPRFILQPLVENAIIHGMEMKMDKGHIAITGIIEENNLLIIQIRDNGNGIEAEKLEQIRNSLTMSMDETRLGIGLLNVHQRIQFYYGKSYGLSIESDPGYGTEITITLLKNEIMRSADSTLK
jgi:two-component system sensor histidine kinase YesM